MRDEDQEFASIVKQEFDENWSPPSAPPAPSGSSTPGTPQADFHLNLYDDDESYRDVPKSSWTMAPLMVSGLAAIGVALIIAILKIILGLPTWVGWIAVACFIGGTAMCVWHLTHAPKDDDPDGTV